jgi:hypothetical protein
MKAAVEILQHTWKEWGVYVYGSLVFSGTYEECLKRAAIE